jgi:Ni/Fe-hydrogenase 1 B-type cytochrome subunit
MTQNSITTITESSQFLQRHSVVIRIWHWLTFIFITSIMITVLLNSTLLNPRKNVGMVQEQLKSKGLNATAEQAFAVSHEYKDKMWGVHKLIGYGIAFLLFSRVVIEFAQPGEEKLKTRFKKALGYYKSDDGDKAVYRHYLGTKISYFLFYLLVLFMALSGLSLAFGRELDIPRGLHGTIKELHSIGQYFMYTFVLIHLTGVVIADNRNIKGIVSGMINGNK